MGYFSFTWPLVVVFCFLPHSFFYNYQTDLKFHFPFFSDRFLQECCVARINTAENGIRWCGASQAQCGVARFWQTARETKGGEAQQQLKSSFRPNSSGGGVSFEGKRGCADCAFFLGIFSGFNILGVRNTQRCHFRSPCHHGHFLSIRYAG